jgi:adenine-specific DNA methylase
VNRTGATCIISGEPIPFDYIRAEGKAGRMGAMLMAIVTEGANGRSYYSPDEWHAQIAASAQPEWIPSGDIPEMALGFRVQLYGMDEYNKLFTPRQLVALTTFSDLVAEARQQVYADALAAGLPDDGIPLREGGRGALAYAEAVSVYLAFATDRLVERMSTIATWQSSADKVRGTFARQAIPMMWDYAEVNPFSNSTGNFYDNCEWVAEAMESISFAKTISHSFERVKQADSANHLSTHVDVISTDPPYYDNIGYADLSDFFYVWLRRNLREVYPDIFGTLLVPKAPELIASPYRHGSKAAANAHFEGGMLQTFTNIRRFVSPDYPLTVYYAFKQQDAEDEDGPLTLNPSRTGGEGGPLTLNPSPTGGEGGPLTLNPSPTRGEGGPLTLNPSPTGGEGLDLTLNPSPLVGEGLDLTLNPSRTGGEGLQKRGDPSHATMEKEFGSDDDSPSPHSGRGGRGVRGSVSSTGWETMLTSLIAAGFSIVGTWPIRTERSARSGAIGTNALASSIVLVCRPRPADAPTISRRAFLDDLRRELPPALAAMQSGNIAPVDLAQASIGPGMAIYSRYSKVLEADGSPMRVRAALGLINQALDEYLAEQDGDIDADTRFAVAWFEQFGFGEGEFGAADVLARAKNTSVAGVEAAGLVVSGRGRVRLVHWREYDPGALTLNLSRTGGEDGPLTLNPSPTRGEGGPLTLNPSPTRGEDGPLTLNPSPTRGEDGPLTLNPSPTRGEGLDLTLSPSRTGGEGLQNPDYPSLLRGRGGQGVRGSWDPQQDKRPTVWEATHHLIERLNSHGETGSAMLMTKMPHDMAAEARNLAYRLYSICERKGWAEHARDYNALVISWAGIGEETARLREAAESGQATQQMGLGGEFE